MTNDKIDELIDALTLKNDDWVEINSSGARKAVEAIKQLRKERDDLREALAKIRDLDGEINPNNYDCDDVIYLNEKHGESYLIAIEALKKAGEHDS